MNCGIFGTAVYLAVGFVVCSIIGDGFIPTEVSTWLTILLWPFVIGFWIIAVLLAIGAVICLIVAVTSKRPA